MHVDAIPPDEEYQFNEEDVDVNILVVGDGQSKLLQSILTFNCRGCREDFTYFYSSRRLFRREGATQH